MVRNVLIGLLTVGALCVSQSARAAHCATLYEHINYGGASLLIEDQDNAWIGSEWNDRVSSLIVAPTCRLIAYEHINYGGRSIVYNGNVSWVGGDWNDIISSYQCHCR